jgi:hypothetical protein
LYFQNFSRQERSKAQSSSINEHPTTINKYSGSKFTTKQANYNLLPYVWLYEVDSLQVAVDSFVFVMLGDVLWAGFDHFFKTRYELSGWENIH